MSEIKKIGVLGSGVMGGGIAALCANAGIEVVNLDIVPKEGGRNSLCEGAKERGLKASPSAFTHPKNAERITCGNFEDDLDKLGECDWIIEAVLENLEIKRDLYQKVEKVRKADAIVSSNTSTIPLHELTEGFSDGFRRHFMITHFFNPPRFMRLLEIVEGPETETQAAERIKQFADVQLGKGLVPCKDTPGFIANRIGVFWLMVALQEAIKMKVPVEVADAVMSRPIGVPKTGVFGLFDLIGIDLMPLIAKEMLDNLPESDRFCQLYEEPERVTKMIAEGYTGRKGKGGFYRLNKSDGKKVKEVIDLATGEYSPARRPKVESAAAAKDGLRNLLTHEDLGGRYARQVMLQFFAYTASLIPEISDDIVSVDRAMKWGYNWKYGPFELIDRLGGDDMAGPAWLAEQMKQEGMDVPSLLSEAGDKPFYRVEGGAKQYLAVEGSYKEVPVREGCRKLEDFKRGQKPVKKNGSARLWDIGDGVLCLEFHSKMNSVDPDIIQMMKEAVTIVPERGAKGLVIANDADNFSVGANLGFFMYAVNLAAWDDLEKVVKDGQDAVMGLKYAPFPVVTGLAGMALGGGCEINLHADAVQACMESYIGLVEVGVGVIPGWGGCKELLLRHMQAEGKGWLSGGAMAKVKTVFETIMLARVAESAQLAQDMLILNDKSRISMNRDRVLSDAKALCLQLAEGYQPPEPATMQLPGASARAALGMAIKGFVMAGKATRHDEVIAKKLAYVLTGGEADMHDELTEQDILDLERQVFMELVKIPETQDRIEHMLETNKPLRN